jgi:triphosphoribosyl-dephospho-CoA synthetase
LVDRRNSGAQRDMDVSTFLTSACARKLLAEGSVLAPDRSKKMEAFDDALIARHLSPRGTADLLAVTWFLAQFATLHEGMDTQ